MRVARVFARLAGLHDAVVEEVSLPDEGVIIVHARPKARERDRCVDTAPNAATAMIPVGTNPERVAFTPRGATAHLTNTGSKSVSEINTTTNPVTATIT